jgi:hypothetical protein
MMNIHWNEVRAPAHQFWKALDVPADGCAELATLAIEPGGISLDSSFVAHCEGERPLEAEESARELPGRLGSE